MTISKCNPTTHAQPLFGMVTKKDKPDASYYDIRKIDLEGRREKISSDTFAREFNQPENKDALYLCMHDDDLYRNHQDVVYDLVLGGQVHSFDNKKNSDRATLYAEAIAGGKTSMARLRYVFSNFSEKQHLWQSLVQQYANM